MKVLVIDYGMGNIASVKRAFEECLIDVAVSNEPKSFADITHYVLPGVGAFPDAMDHLSSRGWLPVLSEIKNLGKPFLGICLGMQLLANLGFEVEEKAGLGFIEGEITSLKPVSGNLKVPHVGWNEVHLERESPLFAGIPDGSDFYFVHSYFFKEKHSRNVVGRTPYGVSFASVVNEGNIYGVQFHPEKSGKKGFQLLKNFINL